MATRASLGWLTAVTAATILLPALGSWAQETAPASQPAELEAAATTQPAVQDEALPVAANGPTTTAPSTQAVEIVVINTQSVDLDGSIEHLKAVLKPRYSEWEMIVSYEIKTRFDAAALGLPLELRVNALVNKALVRDRRWNPIFATIRLETPTKADDKGNYIYRGSVVTPYPYFPIGRYNGISLVGVLMVGDESRIALDEKTGDLAIKDLQGER